KIIDSLKHNYEIIYNRTQTVGFQDDSREIIINEYLNEMESNSMSLAFGVPYKNSSLFSNFNNNLHNSYLQLHSYFGFAGLLMIIVGALMAIRKYIKNKNILYLFLFGSLLIRIMTDTVAFIGILDPLLYYFIITGVNYQYSSNQVVK